MTHPLPAVFLPLAPLRRCAAARAIPCLAAPLPPCALAHERGAAVPRRRSRHAPPASDALLFARARRLSCLHAARKALRKTHGTEPHIADAILHIARRSPSALRPAPRVTVAPQRTRTHSHVHAHDCEQEHNAWQTALEARNYITVKWLWLVAAVARKAHHTYIEAFPEMAPALSLSDMTQEGVCGLMAAVEKWDPSRGYAFDSYAFYCVKHAILRAIENQSRPIRLPVHVLNKLSKMRKVRAQLQSLSAYGEPSIEQVAALAGLDRCEAQMYLQRSKAMWSIDAPLPRRVGGDAEPTLHEFLVDHSVDVARQVEMACTSQAVAELVEASNLEDLERSVLLLKFGLADGVERVRAEVGRILNVRVAKVRRAELSALKKLRHIVGKDISEWTALIS